MRFAWIAVAALPAACLAQVPDVQVKADLGPTFRNEVEAGSDLHWYDPFGFHSTVALQFALEPGFRAYVSQKLERIRHDRDRSQIDESYVEDVGVWRAGKQYLPFGQQRILRDSAIAVRSDSDLFLRELPLSVAACDGGNDRQRGIVGRIGRSLGFSFALGENFGSSATSLTQFRVLGEDKTTGYGRVLGVDATRNVGAVIFRGEYALFRDGEDGAADLDALDLTASLEPALTRSLTFGYSFSSNPDVRSFRVQGRFLVADNLWMEPWVRSRDGRVFDTGVTVRVRL